MHTTKIANRNERRPQIARRCADQQARARRALYLVALLAGACAQTLFSSSLYAQSKSQLTIGKTTELESIDNQTISSVVFTGPYKSLVQKINVKIEIYQKYFFLNF